MPDDATVLAVDLGAESGRVAAVRAADGRLHATELHRFANRPVRVRGSLHWDVLALFAEIERGIDIGLAERPASLGVDTWAVDFALLDGRGELLGNPRHYRDRGTEGALERLTERLDRATIFGLTGIQFLPFNTLVQLFAMVERHDPRLAGARTFLTIPDLFHYWLGGERVCEFTNATTTQLLDPRSGTWVPELLDLVGLNADVFPEVVRPGRRAGSYRGIPVTLPASHDTGSAVAGIPMLADDVAFVSSGTWSLVGTEVAQPLMSLAAMRAGVTNEGAVGGGFRLLKNVMGLWSLQQCRETWASEGNPMSYADIAELAAQEPALRSVVDVDHPDFLPPGDHPAILRRLCSERGEPVPETPGAVARCVFDSLALAYRRVLGLLAELTGRTFRVLHVVGGGSRNRLLNQLTADATGLPVVAGPVEAAVLGNAVVQLMTLGVVDSLADGRAWIARSAELERFEPRGTDAYEAAYARLSASA